MQEPTGRRQFVRSVLGMGAAVVTPVAPGGEPDAPARPAEPAADAPRPCVFFTQLELEFVTAAVARLIPSDDLGPGAAEAGVPAFIDGQLASAWGAHARNYRQGPWAEGTPQQGFQSPLSPRDIYRVAISGFEAHCLSAHGKRFNDLDGATQDQLLRGLQNGAIPLSAVSGRLFFEMLWANTQEGFFADPLYGGNRGKAGWQLIGYPGVAATYIDWIERHGQPYRVAPVSVGDVISRAVQLDPHGHPLHEMLERKGE